MRAYILVGATATGKSAVAQALAERYGRAILSVDSMMVYRGMDIGTAKPSEAERGQVPYYGIDVVAPDEPFSVWDYRQHALAALEECARSGREVIAVGGTGLYVKSLTHGLRDAGGGDADLRARWEERIAAEGVGGLQELLAREMPEAYSALADKDNPRRLLRLLESGGTTAGRRGWQSAGGGRIVGLRVDNAVLHRRIAARVDEMYATGFVAEVERLLQGGRVLSQTASQAIGYAEVIAFLAGRMSLAEARERTVIRTRQLAKRQRTWFRHQADVAWVDVTEGDCVADVADRVEKLWRKYGATEISE